MFAENLLEEMKASFFDGRYKLFFGGNVSLGSGHDQRSNQVIEGGDLMYNQSFKCSLPVVCR